MPATENISPTDRQNGTDHNLEEKYVSINKFFILVGAILSTVVVGLVAWWATNIIVGVIAWGLAFAVVRHLLQQSGILPETAALTKCRACEREIARSARSCPHCGVVKPGKSATEFFVHKLLDRGLLVVVAIAAVCWFIIIRYDLRDDGMQVEVSQLSAVADAGLIDGEIDAGVMVTFVVTNKGNGGSIRVMPSLNSSEGKWTRTQEIQLNAGQSETLTFFFHEPTVNATNLQATVEARSAR